MKFEESCGAVVFTRADDEIRYVLIRSLEGVYGFPKGHRKPGESREETALREIREEVGLSVTLLPGFSAQEEFSLPEKPDTRKRIIYFLAEYENQSIVAQREELSGFRLCSYDGAMRLLQHESRRRILAEADAFLMN